MTSPAYVFGLFRLLPERRALMSQDMPIKLGGRAFDVLVALVQARERVLSKPELMELVWPKLVVEDNNLQVQIVALRKLLGHPAIATVPGRGYRFTLPVVVEGEFGTSPDEAAAAGPLAHAGPAPPERRTNLPERLPALFGRDEDVAALTEAITTRSLVTVAGAGGIGKTRVAQAAAAAALSGFVDGVWWVELAALSDGALAAAAVAQALGIQAGEGRELGASINAVVRSQHLLLVLDNCEHLLDSVAALATSLLAAAPRVHLLVTSQEVLKLADESVYRLGPLALAADDRAATVMASGAGALFVARAQSADRRFELTASNAGAVQDICRRLDGIPLAIELAAARVPLLGVEGLSSRLHERFKILTGGARVVLRRHQTLRAALEWSCGLLGPDEHAVFRRLGVFAGGFTLALAQQVVTDDEIDEWAALDLIGQLVDKSLVVVEGGAAPRYRLLETTRSYATELLAAAGETEAWLVRHANAMLERLEASYAARWKGQVDDGIGQDIDNVRVALDWSLSGTCGRSFAVELHAASWTAWQLVAMTAEGSERCRAVRDWVVDDLSAPVQARYWLAVGKLGIFSARLECFEAAARATDMFVALGDMQRAYDALVTRAGVGARRGEHAAAAAAIEKAQALFQPEWPVGRRSMLAFAAWINALRAGAYEEALVHAWRQTELTRESGNVTGEAIALGNVGASELYIPERLAAGEARLREAQARLLALGKAEYAGHIVNNLGLALTLRGAFDEAIEQGRLALRLLRREGDHGLLMVWLPLLAVRSGKLDAAARLCGFVAAANQRAGVLDRPLQIEAVALLKQQLPAERHQRLALEGAALDEDDAFALLLGGPD